ncbi:thiamine phosphate synthase [Helicobacter cynogastricus]|uniref:thiamine phosphate synthase n=1 Tax=Helicobacter cynogastricus TaxID=329937 RepID=UPI000CF15E43|nr:thiamine phosphate synthase [Helicobacter cynogastricus]
MGIELKGLYGISDPKLTPYDRLRNLAERAIEGGVRFLQLRDKESSDSELLGLAKELSDLCTKKGVGFVINDRLSLALECNAWGLHLGEEDVPLSKARSLFSGVIGVSCYGDLERAKQAQAQGADYVAFGACFRSSSKPSAPCIDLEVLARAKACLTIPVCAIGGVNAHNIAQLQHADMIALISALWQGDVRANAQNLLGSWHAH